MIHPSNETKNHTYTRNTRVHTNTRRIYARMHLSLGSCAVWSVSSKQPSHEGDGSSLYWTGDYICTFKCDKPVLLDANPKCFRREYVSEMSLKAEANGTSSYCHLHLHSLSHEREVLSRSSNPPLSLNELPQPPTHPPTQDTTKKGKNRFVEEQ